ncbi:MAG: hypothetical protein N4A45_04445 [Flavobacteriales bacterium]|jgi:hypothetical protein|nr:hypothetical protein [Flavobacteriales bacterium]
MFFWSYFPLSAKSFSFSKEKEKGYRLYRGYYHKKEIKTEQKAISS